MSDISNNENVKRRVKQLKRKRMYKEIFVTLLAAVLVLCIFLAFNKDSGSSIDRLLKGIKEPVTTEKVDENKELLILVNADNPIPDDYELNLKKLKGGQQVDKRMYDDLNEMFEAMEALGINPYINSAFRSPEKQEQLMEEKISAYEAEGYSREAAEALAAQWVSQPEYSEHMLGLALDITGDTDKGTSVEETQQWLNSFAYLYGFILRYPEGKEDITGYSYEPWHYRYVGKENAKAIHESGMCLEEYVNTLS